MEISRLTLVTHAMVTGRLQSKWTSEARAEPFTTLVEVDVASGVEKPMSGRGWRSLKDFTWLPDGSGLLDGRGSLQLEIQSPEIFRRVLQFQPEFPTGASFVTAPD